MRAAIVRLVIFVAVVVVSSVTARAQHVAPSNLHASVSGSDVVITWHTAGSMPPDAFRLEAGSASGLADLAIVNLPWGAHQGLDAQFAAAGVAPGVYFLRVRSVYGGVPGEASEEFVMRVGTSSCQLPNAPQNVHATVASETVTIAWEAAATGGDAAGYVIEAGSTPGVPNVAIITLDATRVSVSAPPGRYFVRLRAMGICGASEPSPEVVIVVP